MDGTKFDKLAKMLADGSSRRGFLKRAAAVAAGAALVRTPMRAKAAAEATHCYNSYDYSCRECDYGEYPTHKQCDDYTCVTPDTCCGYAPKGFVCEYGEWVCPADYYVAYDGTCIPVDSCTTDYDCTAKNQICSYGKDIVTAETVVSDYYGTCICDYGYKLNDKGKCVPEEGACYSDEDCYTYEYGYYDYKNGKYYDEYGKELPELYCNDYGVCEPVVVVPEPEPEPEPEPKPDNCVKTCITRKRNAAKRSKRSRKGGKSKAKGFRKACKAYCAKRAKRGR